jgi:hypothetical protein
MYGSASTQNPKKEGVLGGGGGGGGGVCRGCPLVGGEGMLWVEIKYDSIGGF